MIPSILVKDLSFKYPDGTSALESINLSIADGEKVSLIGGNGAGKSTLLQLLAGLKKPTSGLVEISGDNVNNGSNSDFNSRIGLIFQDPDDQIFMPRVDEDVAFGPMNLGLDGAEIRRRVRESMFSTGLQGFEKRAPHHISIGEKRRVAIAGVLAMSPDIMLLDEPTSGLDPRGRQEIMKIIEALPKTMLLVTHDMDLAIQFSKRIILLDRTILFDGDCADLFKDADLLRSTGLVRPNIVSVGQILRKAGLIRPDVFPLTYSDLEEAIGSN